MLPRAAGPGTQRLYREDSYLKSFTARVLGAATERDGHLGVALDRTAFYPTGGGQPHDTGRIEGLPVVDVVEDGDGRILHLLRAERVPTGEVTGQIDWERRFDHMQQHSGQHILSRAFILAAGAATQSFHLGETSCTIDIDLADPSEEVMRRAESLANNVVYGNETVTHHQIPPDEQPTLVPGAGLLTVRRGEAIRIIRIGSFDENPCGGTHVRRAGEVGGILVRAWERFKGGTRVTFLCGGRALREARQLGAVVDACVARLSAPAEACVPAIERLQADLVESRRRVEKQAETLAIAEAAALDATARVAGPWRVAVSHFVNRDVEEVQRLARYCVEPPGRVALLGTTCTDGRASLIFARSDQAPTGEPENAGDSRTDMGRLMTRICAGHGGRGGGRPTLARGGGFDAGALARALEEAFGLVCGASD